MTLLKMQFKTKTSVENITKTVLLLTTVDLKRDGAGEIYLRSLMATMQDIRFAIARLPDGGYLEYLPSASPLSRAMTSLTSRMGAWQIIKLIIYKYKKLNEDARQVKDLMLTNGADSCWIPVSSPEGILLANNLQKNGVKILITVLDTPEYLFKSKSLGNYVSDRMMTLFSELIRNANAVSVISNNMKERYQDLYRVKSTVIRPIASNSADKKQPARHRKIFRLVFAGSLYAKKEWNALLKALVMMNWSIADRYIVIYYLGAFPLRGAVIEPNVIRLGHRPLMEATAIIQKCDAGYLPYWLTGSDALVATTSFPSKLSTYIGCGLPIFNHGPEATEVTNIMKDHPIGVSCHSLEANEIISSLSLLVKTADTDFRQVAITNLIRSELSVDNIKQQFTKFIMT